MPPSLTPLGTLDGEGRYRDLGLLGTGGMSEVRRAWDERFHRPVAMKIIRFKLLSKAEYLDRFIEEAHLGSQLEHRGIIPVFDLGQLPDGRFFFTMPVVRGTTLKRAIAEVHASSREGQWRSSESGWTFGRLIAAFQRVCEAMAYAHRQGVIHRDLKPSNVMVGDEDQVFVVDWGLAKVFGELGSSLDAVAAKPVASRLGRDPGTTGPGNLQTHAGATVGTPAYMAPEQVSGSSEDISVASDIYALGGILFQILSGRPPYVGDTARMLMEMIRISSPPKLREICSLPTPSELITICERAMARVASDRYHDVEALASEVEAWLGGGWRAGDPSPLQYKSIEFNTEDWRLPPDTDRWFRKS